MNGNMTHSTPANENPSQREMPKVRNPIIPKKVMGVNGKSAHANIDIDTHYDVIKDAFVPEEFRRTHMNINTVSVEQVGDDYIRLNADLVLCKAGRCYAHFLLYCLGSRGQVFVWALHLHNCSSSGSLNLIYKGFTYMLKFKLTFTKLILIYCDSLVKCLQC